MKRVRRPRGYLLIEAAVAGGVLTIAIGGALFLASSFRGMVTGASRRAEATQIAEARLERWIAGDRRSSFGPEPVESHRGFTVSGRADPVALGVAGLGGVLQRVQVEVHFLAAGEQRTLRLERLVR